MASASYFRVKLAISLLLAAIKASISGTPFPLDSRLPA